ncbi:MAG: PTS mannose transporter subunit IID [Firmicutes bacterium HGW-Firmicutes-7]|nr:MAG: PTS mannose transporter subunit IID [Firmicutes bacterium HGW-Firmicutes-7]
MVGIVIVSHSKQAAEGIRELSMQMAGHEQKIIAVGGTDDGRIGTDALKIYEAIQNADCGKGVVVLVDLGSAVLSTTAAMDLLTEEGIIIDVRLADAPVLEGSVSAAVQAFIGGTIEEVVAAAELARQISKQL